MKYTNAGATFSECRKYRYTLWRTWDESRGHVMFVGLNPSTADETDDDPTIRKCVGFAKSWGYGGIYMLNLFAFRATRPRDMIAAPDPVGPENDSVLRQYHYGSKRTVAAWGNHGAYADRGSRVALMLGNLYCLGLTKAREPKHPLYLAYETPLQLFSTPQPAGRGEQAAC